jgi:protein O-mannosyl-transferase
MASKRSQGRVNTNVAAATSARYRAIPIALLIAVATVAAYWGLARNDFVYYDDNEYLTENPVVRQGLTMEGLKWAFTSFDASNWHPVTWLSHMLDVTLFGMDPAWHHLMNLGFHIANALMLFALLRYLTGRLWSAALVAALFALHPLHVESVAWAAERKDVLSMFFWLAAMWAWIWYAAGPRITRYLAVLLLFALGLMSKPMVVTFPLILLALDYWPLQRTLTGSLRLLIVEKLPMLVMSLMAAGATMMAQRGAITDLGEVSLAHRLANAAVSYFTYIRQMVWPAGLAMHYPYPQQPPYAGAIVAVILLVAITAAVLWLGRKRKYLAFGWIWYLLTLVPVIGIVQVGDQAHADRYTYIPLVGLFIMFVWAAAEAIEARPSLKPVAVIFAVALLVCSAAVTSTTVGYWKDDLTLFGRAIAVTPDNYRIRTKLADALFARGRYDDALAQLRESIRIRPQPDAFAVMGTVYHAMGRRPEAIECYQKALSGDRPNKSALVNAGGVLLDMGRYDEAVTYLRQAVDFQPRSVVAWSLLGRALTGARKFDEAQAAFERAIALDTSSPQAHSGLADLRMSNGDMVGAVEEYRKSIALKKDAVTLANLGMCLAATNDLGRAAQAYRESLAIKPDNVEVICRLALVYERLGSRSEALSLAKKAMLLAPGDAAVRDIYNRLSAIQ